MRLTFVVPDSFTRIIADLQITWFKKGYITGNVNNGYTFGCRFRIQNNNQTFIHPRNPRTA